MAVGDDELVELPDADEELDGDDVLDDDAVELLLEDEVDELDDELLPLELLLALLDEVEVLTEDEVLWSSTCCWSYSMTRRSCSTSSCC